MTVDAHNRSWVLPVAFGVRATLGHLTLRASERTPPPNPLPEAERGSKTGSGSPLLPGEGLGEGLASLLEATRCCSDVMLVRPPVQATRASRRGWTREGSVTSNTPNGPSG